VYYMDNAPEKMLLDKAGAFEGNVCDIYEKIFTGTHHIAKTTKKGNVLHGKPQNISNDVGITQHHGEDKSYVVVINYSGKQVEPELKYSKEYKLVRQIGGTAECLEPFSSVVLEFKKIN